MEREKSGNKTYINDYVKNHFDKNSNIEKTYELNIKVRKVSKC